MPGVAAEALGAAFHGPDTMLIDPVMAGSAVHSTGARRLLMVLIHHIGVAFPAGHFRPVNRAAKLFKRHFEGGFRSGEGIYLGVAIAMKGGGLVAPAIHDADRMGLADLMRALQDLVGRARTGGLRGTEMAEPTITVTSLGDQGVDAVFPVIYPPQVAIVGFGRIRERP